jgi:hypothetical protein
MRTHYQQAGSPREPRKAAAVARLCVEAPSTPSSVPGPHLADFAYDIGSPDLGKEVGLGTDLFFRVTRARVNLEATVFQNRIRNFIHSRPTGELDPRFRRFP